MQGQGLLKGLGLTLKHFFQREITEQYPEIMPDLHERYRGCLQFDHTKCIVCGLCINVCPNNVLSMETARMENSKKKRLVSYTIDFQYCMFCNLCVEACPASTLYFNQNFELAVADRDAIKMVYEFPEGLTEPDAVLIDPEDAKPADQDEEQKALQEQAEKEQKQINAMVTALNKNPQKILAKILEAEEDVAILTELLPKDEKIAAKIAELMVKDKEKAAKVAAGLVNKEKKNRQKSDPDRKEENDV